MLIKTSVSLAGRLVWVLVAVLVLGVGNWLLADQEDDDDSRNILLYVSATYNTVHINAVVRSNKRGLALHYDDTASTPWAREFQLREGEVLQISLHAEIKTPPGTYALQCKVLRGENLVAHHSGRTSPSLPETAVYCRKKVT